MSNQNKIELDTLRHSTSHIMADAVKRLFPNVKLAIGPSIDEGFYYDFDIDTPFTPEDLVKIEKEMSRIIKSNLMFERSDLSHQEAEAKLKDEPYKLEMLKELPDEMVTFYRHGNFIDMCRGPHINSTVQVKYYKLLSATGAYWRGDEKNKMLTRIYGTVFQTKEKLDAFLKHKEEIKKRDHRLLGKELDLFSIHHEEAGPGLVYWHPKGSTIRQAIEDFWKAEHRKSDYEFIYSPHIAKINLWQTSGHWGFYRESMFSPIDIDKQLYLLKPMNCPGHIMVYKTRTRSYRELPLRWAELGTVYRYERSGVIQGLFRVRGFTQDDAHIFCRTDQVHSEVMNVIKLGTGILKEFGFPDFKIRLSTRPAEYVGTVENWDLATDALKKAVEALNIPYETEEGGAVFYGPKADIDIRDCLGRAWQCFTVQVDFNLPERFDLTYSAMDGTRQRPIMIHRALLGSLERFFGILIEHYAGAFPMWLAPNQVTVLPVLPLQHEYAQKIYDELKAKGIRVEIDTRNSRLSERIKEAAHYKPPYIIVVGEKEQNENKIAVRVRGKGDTGVMLLADFIGKAISEIHNKTDTLTCNQ